MKKNYRPGRMAEEIKRIVSELLHKGLKDPRFSGIVSISDVEVSKDASYATLYVSVLGSVQNSTAGEREKQEVLDAFQRAKGLLRKEIGTQLKLRHTPELLFKLDTSQEYGRHIEKIIDELGLDSAPEPEERPEAAERDTCNE